mmetsp:Transcript_44329/g.82824  ORF Transcript_44329/g.82824 Transcript_44329/m.82824 type:complete len:208 (+) Transcript_44329:68-691(+)
MTREVPRLAAVQARLAPSHPSPHRNVYHGAIRGRVRPHVVVLHHRVARRFAGVLGPLVVASPGLHGGMLFALRLQEGGEHHVSPLPSILAQTISVRWRLDDHVIILELLPLHVGDLRHGDHLVLLHDLLQLRTGFIDLRLGHEGLVAVVLELPPGRDHLSELVLQLRLLIQLTRAKPIQPDAQGLKELFDGLAGGPYLVAQLEEGLS